MTSAAAPVASYYTATAHPRVVRPRLEGDLSCDVAVLGGGYTGLSTALHLSERGRRVVLLEAHQVGWGASGRNGGQVHSGQRRDQDTLEQWFGPGLARQLWDLAEEAKRTVKDLIARHGIACDWRDGLIYAMHKPGFVAADHAYAERVARDYGYPHLQPLSRDALAAAIGTPAYFGGTRDADAGHLHALNFALGLAAAAEKAGAVIHEGTSVLRVVRGARPMLVTASGTVTADAVVLAGNGYLSGIDEDTEGRVMPINNYILTTEPLGPRMQALIPGGEAVADSRFVIYYWRPTADGRMLFGGGETYTRRFPRAIGPFVRRHLLRIYPGLGDVRIDHAWGGTLAVTMNRLPYMRRLAPGIYTSGGYSGHGVATATLAGKLLAAAIAGETERFDVFQAIPNRRFPGGRWMRTPTLILAMSWFALRDRV